LTREKLSFEKMLSNERSFHELFSDVIQEKAFTLYFNSNFADDPVFNHAVLNAEVSGEPARFEDFTETIGSIRSAAEKVRVPASIFVEKFASWAGVFEAAAVGEGYRIAEGMSILSKPLCGEVEPRPNITCSPTRDIELWNDIFMRSFRIDYSWRIELLARESKFVDDTRTALLLAREEGGPPASGCLLLHKVPEECAGIYSVGTLPERRGRSVARSLMQAAESYALQEGCEFATLQTVNSDGVTPMYLKMGYKLEFQRDILQYF
jgi:GNAT superfamily N-acetyltransferase